MENREFDKIIKELDNVIKNNEKILCILRGLPGSGKSTLAKNLVTSLKIGVIYSADNYFNDLNGNYNFNPQQLGHAHSWNQLRTKEGMKSNIPLIIIDNTNVSMWEMEPYIKMAQSYQYLIKIMEPFTWWKNNVKELFRRNTHGVNIQTIKQMALRFEPWEDDYTSKLKSTYSPDPEKYQQNRSSLQEDNRSRVCKFVQEPEEKIGIASKSFVLSNYNSGSHSFPTRSCNYLKSRNNQSASHFSLHELNRVTLFGDSINTQEPNNSDGSSSNDSEEKANSQNLTISNQLFSMFPHVPRTEVQEMLSACSNNVEWTIDLLLSLEPPNVQTTTTKIENLETVQNTILTLRDGKPEVEEQNNKDSFAHIIEKINEIKPFYPTPSASNTITDDQQLSNQGEFGSNMGELDTSSSIPTTEEFCYENDERTAPLPSHNHAPSSMPVSIPLRLDPAFLISMQAIHNIPPLPFTRESLESFGPKVDLDFSQAQSLYFKWIAGMEAEPRFNATFYFPSHHYQDYNGDLDHFDTESCDTHSAECSCKLNPVLGNTTPSSKNHLKPKPFAEILLEEQTKHFGNRYNNGDGWDWNYASSSNSNAERPGKDNCLANSIKRKLLLKKFPNLDSALVDEIFWGHGFDLDAATTFVDNYLSPQLKEENRLDIIGNLNESMENQVIMRTDDLLNGMDENADDNEVDDEMEFDVVERWYNKRPDLGPNIDVKTLGLINKNLVDVSNKNFLKEIKCLNPNPGAEERNAIYRSFRGEAFANHELRMECLAKALTAARSCKKPFRGGISDYYRETARDYDGKAKAANRKAVNSILGVNNYGMSLNSLDLHGLHVAEVIPVLKRYLNWAAHKIRSNGSDASKFHKVMIITGRGKTKSSQHSRLNYAVRNYLNTKGYPPFEECNPGTFTLYMVHKNYTNSH